MPSRREFLKQVAVGSAVAAFVAACKSSPAEPRCDDVSALSDPERTMRTTLKYEEHAQEAGKTCSNCNFFTAPAQAGCGGCTLIKGPINPGGHCTSWIQKKA